MRAVAILDRKYANTKVNIPDAKHQLCVDVVVLSEEEACETGAEGETLLVTARVVCAWQQQ